MAQIDIKPYRRDDSFYISAKANVEGVLKRSVDQNKLHKIRIEDYLDKEDGRIWLVLDMLCREGRGNKERVNEASLVTRVCELEAKIKLLHNEKNPLPLPTKYYKMNWIELYLTRTVLFTVKIEMAVLMARILVPSRLQFPPSKQYCNKNSNYKKSQRKSEVDMLMPQRLNEVTLHTRYSILSDSALNEAREDNTSEDNNDTEDNKLKSKSYSTEQQ